MDNSFIPANVPHRFNNIGDEPLTIFWIYGETNVTRTFTETGETVQHLSSGDKVTNEKYDTICFCCWHRSNGTQLRRIYKMSLSKFYF